MFIALVSLDQHWQDKDANFFNCVEFVQQAHKYNCDLIVFPEMTLTGYSLDVDTLAEPEKDSPTLLRFGQLAKKYGLSIIFGACLINPLTNRSRNQFCIAHEDGSSFPIYAKVHHFSFSDEHKVIEAGENVGIAKFGNVSFGASICYDLRFPEIYALMAPYCSAAINIANWPQKRISHWRSLLVARAIENQFFMLGINRTGIDDNHLVYERSSMVVSPDGIILQPFITHNEMDIYEMNLEKTELYRSDFPTLRDKRYETYKNILESMNVE